jgi:hypothetical protein
MRIVTRIALLSVAVLATGATTRKECYGNDVCRVETDGVVTWEGPPDKVAEMKAKEDARKQKGADLDRAYADAPKRPTTEPIRLVLVGPTAESPELKALGATYRAMMEQGLQGDPRLQLVPYSDVKLLVEADSGSTSLSGQGGEKARVAVDEALTRRLRDLGGEVDVVLVAHLVPKKVTGLVGGGGGVGVAEVNNVEFQGSLSSIYRFEPRAVAEVGKSSDSLAVAGVSGKGKAGSGEIKGKRNPEQDRAAVQAWAASVKGVAVDQIGPTLPALASVKEIRAQSGSPPVKIPDWLKRFQKKK